MIRLAPPLSSFSLLAAILLTACSSAPPPPAVSPSAESPIVDAPDPTDPRSPLPLFHSKRFATDIRLPDGRSWRIDDHKTPMLVATHEATRAKITFERFTLDELANRARCEKEALHAHIISAAPMNAVEDVNETSQESYDTHVVVAVEPAAEGGPIVGHVIAVGGYLHKCFAFDYRTEVASEAEAEKLSERLAFVRARVFGGLRIERFDDPAATSLKR